MGSLLSPQSPCNLNKTVNTFMPSHLHTCPGIPLGYPDWVSGSSAQMWKELLCPSKEPCVTSWRERSPAFSTTGSQLPREPRKSRVLGPYSSSCSNNVLCLSFLISQNIAFVYLPQGARVGRSGSSEKWARHFFSKRVERGLTWWVISPGEQGHVLG